MEEFLINQLVQYGYIILFIWCMLEGEMALIMGGILAHTGDMDLALGIFVAGLGGFMGDQVYFYIGRYNKKYIQKKLEKQKRKFAIAHLLLQKYGGGIIFVQRYLYGLRTIIPIFIGFTRYNPKKFALINIISAWCWASITMIPAWYFGEEILIVLGYIKQHWYLMIPLLVFFVGGFFYVFRKIENNIMQKRKNIEIQN